MNENPPDTFHKHTLTSVVQQALAVFSHPDNIILFVTGKAKTQNLSTVITSFSAHPYTIIDIPDGQTDTTPGKEDCGHPERT